MGNNFKILFKNAQKLVLYFTFKNAAASRFPLLFRVSTLQTLIDLYILNYSANLKINNSELITFFLNLSFQTERNDSTAPVLPAGAALVDLHSTIFTCWCYVR